MTESAVYRFAFDGDVSLDEVEGTMALALIGVQALHGEAGARLGAGHYFDRLRRACVIDGRTPVGRDLGRLFTGFLTREFGETGFTVEPAEPRPSAASDEQEFKTFADWAEELTLDAGEVARLIATDPSLSLSSPLTRTELNDLVGLLAQRPSNKEAGR